MPISLRLFIFSVVLLSTALLSTAHPLSQLVPSLSSVVTSRAFRPGHSVGIWSRLVGQSSRSCPRSINHLAYRRTINKHVFIVKHDDIAQDRIECTGGSELIFVSSAAILDPGLLTRGGTSPAIKRRIDDELREAQFMKTARELDAENVKFFAILELGTRTCGASARFEDGTKGFFIAEAVVDVALPPFSTLPAGKKYMALFEAGIGGRRCLYDASIGKGPLPKPLNALPPPTAADASSPESAPEGSPGAESAESSTPPKEIEKPTKDKRPTSGSSESTKNDPPNDGRRVFGGSVTPAPTPACFPAHATVVVDEVSDRRMDELKVGDKVQVGERGVSSTVFMFTHRDKLVNAEFVRMTTEDGQALEATAGHFVLVNDVMKPAGDVLVGDYLSGANGERRRIVKLSMVKGIGLYNPQTLHGRIVVNGFVCSTYTTAVHPDVAHSALAPLRGLFRAFSSVFAKATDSRLGYATAASDAKDFL